MLINVKDGTPHCVRATDSLDLCPCRARRGSAISRHTMHYDFPGPNYILSLSSSTHSGNYRAAGHPVCCLCSDTLVQSHDTCLRMSDLSLITSGICAWQNSTAFFIYESAHLSGSIMVTGLRSYNLSKDFWKSSHLNAERRHRIMFDCCLYSTLIFHTPKKTSVMTCKFSSDF